MATCVKISVAWCALGLGMPHKAGMGRADACVHPNPCPACTIRLDTRLVCMLANCLGEPDIYRLADIAFRLDGLFPPATRDRKRVHVDVLMMISSCHSTVDYKPCKLSLRCDHLAVSPIQPRGCKCRSYHRETALYSIVAISTPACTGYHSVLLRWKHVCVRHWWHGSA